MRRAIVELRGCASYRKGNRIFVKDQPQVVEGDSSVAFFRGREEFSVRELAPIVEKVAEPEPVEFESEPVEDDLPPPAEPGELASTGKKRKVVKKRS